MQKGPGQMVKKKNQKQILEWMIKNSKTIFLVACLLIHLALWGLYYILDVPGMVYLNTVSVICYLLFLLFRVRAINGVVIAAYFEIMVFSVLGVFMTGIGSGFLFYVLGILPVIFYLLNDLKVWRVILQFLGILVMLVTYGMEGIIRPYFKDYQQVVEPYNSAIYILNLLIAALCMIIVSFLHTMNQEKISELLEKKNEELEYQAGHDALTGVLNRRYMMRYMNRAMQRKESMVHVGMADLDYFKRVNDTYGHEAGDAVLERVSDCMKNHLPGWTVSRWGGEEFLFFAENKTHEEAYQDVDEFRKKVAEQTVICNEKEIQVTVTIGLISTRSIRSIDDLVDKSDRMLYAGKAGGKNCVVTTVE